MTNRMARFVRERGPAPIEGPGRPAIAPIRTPRFVRKPARTRDATPRPPDVRSLGSARPGLGSVCAANLGRSEDRRRDGRKLSGTVLSFFHKIVPDPFSAAGRRDLAWVTDTIAAALLNPCIIESLF